MAPPIPSLLMEDPKQCNNHPVLLQKIGTMEHDLETVKREQRANQKENSETLEDIKLTLNSLTSCLDHKTEGDAERNGAIKELDDKEGTINVRVSTLEGKVNLLLWGIPIGFTIIAIILKIF